MIILDSIDKKLVAKINTAPNLDSLDYIVQYADVSLDGCFGSLSQVEGDLNITSSISLLEMTSSFLRRDIKFVKIHNSDDSCVNLTLSVSSSNGQYDIFNGMLGSKYTLFYDADGLITIRDKHGKSLISDPLAGSLFVDLMDTPSNYTSSAGKAVIVNNTETGIIFSNIVPSSSFALTASYVDNAANVYISQSGQDVELGNIIAETITANQLNISEVTRSILYQSGSTKFGDTLDDTHQFTGSFSITGSSITHNGNSIPRIILPVPTSTSDPRGEVGDISYSETPYRFYIKTNDGWYRSTLASF